MVKECQGEGVIGWLASAQAHAQHVAAAAAWHDAAAATEVFPCFAGTGGWRVLVCVLFVGASSFTAVLPLSSLSSVCQEMLVEGVCGPAVAAACHSSRHVCMLPGVVVVVKLDILVSHQLFGRMPAQ